MKVQIKPRWRDMDALGHVNNATFLTYIEEARLQWLDSLAGDWMNDAIAPVVASCHIQYKYPITDCEPIDVTALVERVGGSSITMSHVIRNEDQDILYAVAEVMLVWVNRKTGKPIRVPKVLREES